MTETPSHDHSAANSAVVALSLFNGCPVGSLLDYNLVVDYDQILVEYGIVPEVPEAKRR